MKNILIKEREEISTSISKEQYKEAIEKCKTLLNKIDIEFPEDNYNRWYAHLKLAIIYKRLNQSKKLLYHANMSLNYTSQEQIQYIDSLWVIGNYYFQMKSYKKALKFYTKCQQHFQLNNMKNDYLLITYNIAFINQDKQLLEDILHTINTTDTTVQWLTGSIYEVLCEIYIQENNIYKFVEYSKFITDETVLINLQNKIRATNVVSIL